MWHPVAFADDLDDQPMAVRLLDEAIAIARIDGDVAAFNDLCIHRGTASSLGTVVDGGLQCANHGWTFYSTGACVLIPSRPEGSIPRKARVQSYAVQESIGLVWVCVEPPAEFPIPTYSPWDDGSFRTVRIPL